MPQTLSRLHLSLRRFSLRQRILLLFAGLAGAAMLALLLGLYLGYAKHNNPWALDALIVGGVLSGCAILALVVGMWLLFDEHVAKPLQRLAGELRTRAHTTVGAELEDLEARHLGDLAPAAAALMRHLNETRNELAETIARETARHVEEKQRLLALLSELPVGLLVCGAGHNVVLYNSAAQALLSESDGSAQNLAGRQHRDVCDPAGAGPICLGRPVFDYLDEAAVRQAIHAVNQTPASNIELSFLCPTQGRSPPLQARIRLLSDRLTDAGRAGGYMLTLQSAGPLEESTVSDRLVYDFDLLTRELHTDIANTPLDALSYVVLDTETTGLRPDLGDEIVQLAAVRIVNGRRVKTEVLNTLVNPGRPIPLASSRIHGISDDMVADAPGIEQVGRRLHQFSRGAVLVAHNAGFDMAFLRRAEPHIGLRFDHPVLDTVQLSAVVFGTAQSHSLDVLAARLGVSLPAAVRHTALGDATATAEVLLKLLPALQARGLRTFGELEEECRRHGRLTEWADCIKA